MPQGRRHLRAPGPAEVRGLERASEELTRRESELPLPSDLIRTSRRDDRPLSYGIREYRQMFTDRQLLVFGRAFQWIRSSSLPDNVRDSLELAISNALSTNNRLCGYATDYGRLAPLFFIRGFSLPALAVELNPLARKGGRGTLAACLARAVNPTSAPVRRHYWCADTGVSRREAVSVPSLGSQAYHLRPRRGRHAPARASGSPLTSRYSTRRTSISLTMTSCRSSTAPGWAIQT